MEEICLNIILIIFPILMYLVFYSFKEIIDKEKDNTIFIITMLSSLYLALVFNKGNPLILIFYNIPILICYFKREWQLALAMSIIVTIFSYHLIGMGIYVVLVKYALYFITYIILCNRKEFNYLFFKISGVIQGLLISLEYFTETYEMPKLINIFICVGIIYVLTFFSLYLFKIASNICNMYVTVNKMQDENKLKNALFKLTHEIKNPIAVCKGYLDMINLDNKEKSIKYIEIIKSEINRSLNVIADFMEYSKIKINKELFDVVLLMDEVYESFSLLSCNKRITINYDNKYDEIYMNGDYERLKQVFVNIIKNSIESIDNFGIIDIDLKLIDKYLLIIIKDNGIGMDKEELANIKEMFFTTKKNGTGLGIALSNEIVMAHGGAIYYESEKNIGTKCTVKLPLGG